MVKKMKNYASDFKFNIVLESFVSGNVSDVARSHEVHPDQLLLWREEFISYGHIVFEKNPPENEKVYRTKIENLQNQIGKKDIEINMLKNYLDFLSTPYK